MIKVELAMLTGRIPGLTHIAIERSPDGTSKRDDYIHAACGLVHDEPISFLDCPVASRWTLVRAK